MTQEIGCFIPDVRPVWSEANRVLRRGGHLLAGVTNPVRYVFDEQLEEQGQLVARHSIPYSDLTSLDETERAQLMEKRPLEFGHTLEDQIGGQLDAGFVITDLYEDRYDKGVHDLISAYLPTFIATRASKS